jgi:beta-lactamase regulating signal transducer with metallopeptidase domain
MDLLLPIAAKSFLVAGAALLLLMAARKRSAAERSWIAHLGLAAVLVLPIAAVALPTIEIEAPGVLSAQVAQPETGPATQPTSDSFQRSGEAAVAADTFPVAQPATDSVAAVDWSLWIYGLPAALLLLLTLIALGRLFALRGRAHVMVEPHWLTALARAQRRMGFKHGTALLTSDELPSPISWGLMRPVILLNSEATESHSEAEAIIAHELAHVASLDWAKLLLARITVALFWFNPLVWLLAREAHQLREEAADDAVLGANIEDTEYAKLLVGVARHECRGLLLGAHGVAPAKNSLTRRVRRVLDATSVRGPVGRAFAFGMFAGMAMLAAPLAAVTLTAKTERASLSAEPRMASGDGPSGPYYVGSAEPAANMTTAVNETIDEAVTTAAQAVAAVHPALSAVAAHEPTLQAPREPRDVRTPAAHDPVERAIELKAIGVTPGYVAGLRAAAPHLRLDADVLAELRAVGVTPEFVRDVVNAGYRRVSSDQLVEARVHGVNGSYVRALAGAGYRGLPLSQVTEMKVMGVSPSDVERLRRAGYRNLTPKQLIEMKVHGVSPDELDIASDHEDEDGS